MKSVKFSAVALVLLLAAIAPPAIGQEVIKFIHTAKSATALVVLPGESGFASAFCIDSAGYFITNYHVVKGLKTGDHLTLVLNSGEEDEKSVAATSVRIDQEDDLAIVKADPTPGAVFTPLPLGSSDQLVETQAVTALGYPFGGALALEKSTRPSVSVNIAHISSMRKSKGKLQLIQLDSQLNPGNSGGPVIDEKGAVIGIVSSGVRGAGINFAVPVSKLTTLLDRPELSFTPPAISNDKIHESVRLLIRAIPFGKPHPDTTIDVILSTAGGGERTFPAQRGLDKDSYTAYVVPVPARVANTVPAQINFAEGSIRCFVDDEAIRLDDKPFKLSQLSKLEFKSPGAMITQHDGTTVTGATVVLQPITAHFGSYSLTVDPAHATSIVLGEGDKAVPTVNYRIVAKSKGTVIEEIKGVLIGTADPLASADPATGGGESPADAAEGPGGPWISLADKIQVKRDTDVGNWEMAANVLRNIEQRQVESTRITIPVRPTGDFVFEFTFERSENGKDLCVTFPVGKRGAMIWVGAFDGQQSSLDGTDARGRGDLVRIMAGKPHKVRITVQNHGATSSVKMELNGVDFLDWTGNPERLQVNAGRATRDGRTLGFAVCHHTVVEFSNMRVRALTGTIAPYVEGE